MDKAATTQRLNRERVKVAYDAMRPACEAALQAQSDRIRSLLEHHGYTPTIKYRVKHFHAYFRKLQQGESPVTDLLGLRIICPFLEDVEQIEALLTDECEVAETERKGAEHSFREFGYDSVHLLLRLPSGTLEEPVPGSARVFEIQLRTILQDAWAEVEHELIYKSDISVPNDSIKRKLASLNATLTLSDLIFQEIRDYHKEMREKGLRRRQSMEREVLAQFDDSTTAAPVVLASGSAVERTMLAALRAHISGEMAAAIDLYSQLLRMKLTPQVRAVIYNHRGMAHFALSDYRKALSDFSKAVDLDDDNYRGLNNRALTWRVLKHYDRSLEDYARSLERNPVQRDGYWGRAQSLYEMGLLSRALADCEEVLELEPGHSSAGELARCIRREIF